MVSWYRKVKCLWRPVWCSQQRHCVCISVWRCVCEAGPVWPSRRAQHPPLASQECTEMDKRRAERWPVEDTYIPARSHRPVPLAGWQPWQMGELDSRGLPWKPASVLPWALASWETGRLQLAEECSVGRSRLFRTEEVYQALDFLEGATISRWSVIQVKLSEMDEVPWMRNELFPFYKKTSCWHILVFPHSFSLIVFFSVPPTLIVAQFSVSLNSLVIFTILLQLFDSRLRRYKAANEKRRWDWV